jgi:hypothetical protein
VPVERGLLDRVVRRKQLAAQGKSGAQLERCWLDDGSCVVVKYVDARQDWIMQDTADQGRIAALWSSGTYFAPAASQSSKLVGAIRASGPGSSTSPDMSVP